MAFSSRSKTNYAGKMQRRRPAYTRRSPRYTKKRMTTQTVQSVARKTMLSMADERVMCVAQQNVAVKHNQFRVWGSSTAGGTPRPGGLLDMIPPILANSGGQFSQPRDHDIWMSRIRCRFHFINALANKSTVLRLVFCRTTPGNVPVDAGGQPWTPDNPADQEAYNNHVRCLVNPMASFGNNQKSAMDLMFPAPDPTTGTSSWNSDGATTSVMASLDTSAYDILADIIITPNSLNSGTVGDFDRPTFVEQVININKKISFSSADGTPQGANSYFVLVTGYDVHSTSTGTALANVHCEYTYYWKDL